MSGGMQAAIGNHNKQTMSNEDSAPNIPTQAEVVELLAQIEQLIQSAELPEAVKEKAKKYVETAKIEAEEKEPDKQLISRNLERVTKNLEEADKTVDASNNTPDNFWDRRWNPHSTVVDNLIKEAETRIPPLAI